MVKKFLKRTLSVALVLAMLITTFCFFDIGSVFPSAEVDKTGQIIAAAGSGTYYSNVSMSVPEVIYMTPGGTGSQYFLNFNSDGSISQKTSSSGDFSFLCGTANSVTVTAELLTTSLGAVSGNSVTSVTFGDGGVWGAGGRVSNGSINTSITKLTLADAASDNSYIIRWKFAFICGTYSCEAYAYTGVKCPSLKQAGMVSYSEYGVDYSTPKMNSYAFITGVDSVSGGNAASSFTGVSSGNIAPLVSFSSSTMPKINDDNTDSKFQTYFPTTAGGGVFKNTREFNHDDLDSIWHVSGYDAFTPTGGYVYYSDVSGGDAHDCGYGMAHITIDRSRFTNLNQIPNLRAGWAQLYAQRSGDVNRLKNLRNARYLAGNQKANNVIKNSSSNTQNATDYCSASTIYCQIDAGDMGNDNNVHTKGLYPIQGAVPASNGTTTTYLRYELYNGNGNKTNYAIQTVGLKYTSVDKSDLREAYAQYLSSGAFSVSGVYDLYSGSFKTNLETIVTELCDTTKSTTSFTSISTALTDAVDTLKNSMHGSSSKPVAFMVPEVIYLAPNGTSWKEDTYTPFQYFVQNNITSTDLSSVSNLANASATHSTDYAKAAYDESGNIYFGYENIDGNVEISYRWVKGNSLDTVIGYGTSGDSLRSNYWGQIYITPGSNSGGGSGSARYAENLKGNSNFNVSGASHSMVLTPNSGNKYIVSATISASNSYGPVLSSDTSGAYIQWIARYKDKMDGYEKVAVAYTYVYKPFTEPVGSGLNIGNGITTRWNGHVSWISGVHSISEKGTSGYTTFDSSWQGGATAWTGENGFASFISKKNEGYYGLNNKVTSGSKAEKYTPSTAQINGGASNDYMIFKGTNAAGVPRYNSGKGNSDAINCYVDGTSANNYTINNFDAGKYYKTMYDYVLGVLAARYQGEINIDTSRYSNLNQIPNLSVGAAKIDDKNNKEDYVGFWAVSDMTGSTAYDVNNKWYRSDSNGDWGTLYNTGTDFVSQKSGSTNFNVVSTEGVFYAGTWPRALVVADSANYRVKTMFGGNNKNGDNYKTMSVTINTLKATQVDKSNLRKTVDEVQSNFAAIGIYDTDFNSYYYVLDKAGVHDSDTLSNLIMYYKEAVLVLTTVDKKINNNVGGFGGGDTPYSEYVRLLTACLHNELASLVGGTTVMTNPDWGPSGSGGKVIPMGGSRDGIKEGKAIQYNIGLARNSEGKFTAVDLDSVAAGSNVSVNSNHIKDIQAHDNVYFTADEYDGYTYAGSCILLDPSDPFNDNADPSIYEMVNGVPKPNGTKSVSDNVVTNLIGKSILLPSCIAPGTTVPFVKISGTTISQTNKADFAKTNRVNPANMWNPRDDSKNYHDPVVTASGNITYSWIGNMCDNLGTSRNERFGRELGNLVAVYFYICEQNTVFFDLNDGENAVNYMGANKYYKDIDGFATLQTGDYTSFTSSNSDNQINYSYDSTTGEFTINNFVITESNSYYISDFPLPDAIEDGATYHIKTEITAGSLIASNAPGGGPWISIFYVDASGNKITVPGIDYDIDCTSGTLCYDKNKEVIIPAGAKFMRMAYAVGQTGEALGKTLNVSFRVQLTLTDHANTTFSPYARTLNHGDQYGMLPYPERDGYEFVGWFTEPYGGSLVTAGSVMGDDDITLYAHWKIASYMVLLDNEFYFANYVEKLKLSGSTILPNTQLIKLADTNSNKTYMNAVQQDDEFGDDSVYLYRDRITSGSEGHVSFNFTGTGKDYILKAYVRVRDIMNGTFNICLDSTSNVIEIYDAPSGGYVYVNHDLGTLNGNHTILFSASGSDLLFSADLSDIIVIESDSPVSVYNSNTNANAANANVSYNRELGTVSISRKSDSSTSAYTNAYSGADGYFMTLEPGASYVFSCDYQAAGAMVINNCVFFADSTHVWDFMTDPYCGDGAGLSVQAGSGTFTRVFTVPEGYPETSIRFQIFNSDIGKEVVFSNIVVQRLPISEGNRFNEDNPLGGLIADASGVTHVTCTADSTYKIIASDIYGGTSNDYWEKIEAHEAGAEYKQLYDGLYVPEREGYTFLGWFTAPTGGKQITDSTGANVCTDNDGKALHDGTKLYSHWTPMTFTLVYDNGKLDGSTVTGTEMPSSTPVAHITYGYSTTGLNPGVISDAIPKSSGKVFIGWAEDEEAEETDTFYYPEQVVDVATVNRWFREATKAENNNKMTIYSQWLDTSIADSTSKDEDEYLTKNPIVDVAQGITVKTDGSFETSYDNNASFVTYTEESYDYYKESADNYIDAKDTVLSSVTSDTVTDIKSAISDLAEKIADLKDNPHDIYRDYFVNGFKIIYADGVEPIKGIEGGNNRYLPKDMNLNHYEEAELDSAMNNLKAGTSYLANNSNLKVTNQKNINDYVVAMATAFASKKSIAGYDNMPEYKVYENTSALKEIPTGERVGVMENLLNNDDIELVESVNYVYTGKSYYTYYCYTCNPNPNVILDVNELNSSRTTYPTRSTVQTASSNATAGYTRFVVDAGATIQNVNNNSNLYNKYLANGIGTDYKAKVYTDTTDNTDKDTNIELTGADYYNVKSQVQLTPHFAGSGAKGTATYTITSGDDTFNTNYATKSALTKGINSAANTASDIQTLSLNNTDVTPENTITIIIDYKGPNGFEVTSDQVCIDTWLSQFHLFRTSGGASNWEFPLTGDSVYTVYDSHFGEQNDFASFTYTFMPDKIEGFAPLTASEWDTVPDTDSLESIDLVNNKKVTGSPYTNLQIVREYVNNNHDNIVNDTYVGRNKGGSGLGYWVWPQNGWSCNYYPPNQSYTYFHVIDRWGNIAEGIVPVPNIDPSAPVMAKSGSTPNNVKVDEIGGSGIASMSLGKTFEIITDENSTFENNVFRTTGNRILIRTGAANTNYTLSVTDNVGNKSTLTVKSDASCMIIIDVTDEAYAFDGTALTFMLDKVQINLYDGVEKHIRNVEGDRVVVGSPAVITITTCSDVTMAQIVNDKGNTLTATDFADNGDGTRSWFITRTNLKVGEYTFGTKVKIGKEWIDEGKTATVTVVEKPAATSGRVVDVDYVPAAGSVNTYEVKVLDRANMLQFIELDHGTGTRSFDRYSENVVIKSYDNEDNEVDSKSRTLAYEIWTVTTKLGDGTIGARVKERGSSKWEDMSLIYTFENIYAEADSGVKSAKLAAEWGNTGPVYFTVITGTEAQYVQLKTDAGSTTTVAAEKATVNEDGTLTFTGKVWFKHAGENTAIVRILDANGWKDVNTLTYFASEN